MLNLTITRCVHLSMMLKSGAKLRLFIGMAKCCGRFSYFRHAVPVPIMRVHFLHLCGYEA